VPRLTRRVAALWEHQREGLAPVALPCKQPVAQLVVDLAVAQALLLKPLRDLRPGGAAVRSVPTAGAAYSHCCVYPASGGGKKHGPAPGRSWGTSMQQARCTLTSNTSSCGTLTMACYWQHILW
jgi:hypothetical protein